MRSDLWDVQRSECGNPIGYCLEQAAFVQALLDQQDRQGMATPIRRAQHCGGHSVERAVSASDS
jgi:hypothetical protein